MSKRRKLPLRDRRPGFDLAPPSALAVNAETQAMVDRLERALDDEERAARGTGAPSTPGGQPLPWAASPEGGSWGVEADIGWGDGASACVIHGPDARLSEGMAEHIARQDPAYTLARVAATREILAAWRATFDNLPAEGVTQFRAGRRHGLELALRAIAAAYPPDPDPDAPIPVAETGADQ